MASRLRSIDLVELRGLCLAIELGSLGRAAAAMSISQPALSKRIRELELFAGVALLERSPRGVTATAAGERLYRESRALLGHAESVEQTLDELRGERAPVRLAASHTIAEFMLAEPLAAYRERLGHGFALELVVANSAVVRDLVRERRADFGLAAAPGADGTGRELRERELCADVVSVAVCAGHPWAATGRVGLEEFLATPMLMRDPSANTRWLLDSELRARGLSAATPIAEVGSTAAAISAAISAVKPAVLSGRAIAATPPLQAVQVEGLVLHRTFVLVERENVVPSPAAADLIAYLSTALTHNPRFDLSGAGGP